MKLTLRALLAVVVVGLSLLGPGTTVPAVADPPAEFAETGCEHLSDSLYRLYRAAFGRVPDEAGFDYWLGLYQSGEFPLSSQAGYFITSPEFVGLYGADPSDEDFVDNLYDNVLGRPGELEGRSFWLNELAAGLSRWQLLLAFTDSIENIARTETVAPMLGNFNEGLADPWSCEQPSCSVSYDDTTGEARLSYMAISVRTTRSITLHVETSAPGAVPVVDVHVLGPARSGERMGAITGPVEATSCEVVAVIYDPSPYVAPEGTCSILPPTGRVAYDVAIDFVVDAPGDIAVAVAVRDTDGHRLANGEHRFAGAALGFRISERSTSYPLSSRDAASCEILSISYSN